jgi:hypothetical protein
MSTYTAGRSGSPFAVLDAQVDAVAVVERVAFLAAQQRQQLDRAAAADHDLVAKRVQGHAWMQRHPRLVVIRAGVAGSAAGSG